MLKRDIEGPCAYARMEERFIERVDRNVQRYCCDGEGRASPGEGSAGGARRDASESELSFLYLSKSMWCACLEAFDREIFAQTKGSKAY